MTGAPTYAICPRCGVRRQIRTIRPSDVCGDCKLVTSDLGEYGLWAAG